MKELLPSDIKLSGLDTLFLKIERPRRLMTVTSIWTFKNRLDSNQVYEALNLLCAKYPRFARVPKNESFFRTARWVSPIGWKPKDNIILHTLSEPTEEAFQAYCAEQVVTPFDYKKPLWEVHAISGLEDDQCAFFWKAHHSLSDGEGFVRSLLSTTSLADTLEELEKKGYQQHKRNHRPQQEKNKYSFFWLHLCHFLWNIYFVTTILLHDLYSFILCCIPYYHHRDFYYQGLQSYDKEMAWSKGVNMKEIKLVRQAFGGTLNDVMLTVLTRAIKAYLDNLGRRQDDYIQLLIPISLREPNDWSIHNIVSGSWGFFSMKDLSTRDLTRQVTKEMLVIKASQSPRLLFQIWENLLGKIPGLSPPLWVYDHFCDIAHGVFTNIPGPVTPISFAGQEIQEYRCFPPQVGKGTLGIGLISYCGKVSIGCLTDKHHEYPELAKNICERFTEEFEIILEEAKMVLSKKK